MVKLRPLNSNLINEISPRLIGVFMVQVVDRVPFAMEAGVRVIHGHGVLGIKATVHDAKRPTVTEYSAEVKGAVEMEWVEDLAWSERKFHTVFEILRVRLLSFDLIFLHKSLNIDVLVRLRRAI
jgi:hypothetical protein